jgi:acetolactate synthase-1/2/3 large subunit
MHNEDNVTYQNVGTVSGGLLSEIKPEQRPGALRGAQLLARALQAEGVDTLFGYPGGANLEIFDVLREFGIRCIRTEHEQGAAHAAQGYARATGRVGVCLATSGPGATNLVTGIADANSDSTAIVAITGNVPSHLLGRNAFQEVDIVAVTGAITKKNYLVEKVTDIPEVVREAFALAAGNRPGPVLIDIPKDIQQHYPRDPEGNYTPPRIPAVIEQPEAPIGGMSSNQLDEACRLIREATRPVIYAGGGIVSANCSEELQRLAEKLQCPVTTTLMGHGAFPPGHALALHSLGMHGSRYANVAVNEADLVLAMGVRFDDRVTGNLDAFIASGKIIHIDIDRDELNKNKTVTLPICADIKAALLQLHAQAAPGDTRSWLSYVQGLRTQFPFTVPDRDSICPQYAIEKLCELTGGEAIVSLGVGQHQMWAMQHYRSTRPRSFLSSSGFGTMGYGLPAAVGAKVGCPERLVIDIDGGSGSDLSDPMAVKPEGETGVYPDFVKIAGGYRVSAERVTDKAELPAAFSRMLSDPAEPYLLDVIVEAEENVYPMIPAGGSYDDIIMGPEDMPDSALDSQGSNI